MTMALRLLFRPAWAHGESLNGYVDRLFKQNGRPLPGAVTRQLTSIARGRCPVEVAALTRSLFHNVGITEGYQEQLSRWLAFRAECGSGKLFRLDRRHGIRCKPCELELGFRPALWDLGGYFHCPVHAVSMGSIRRPADQRVAGPADQALAASRVALLLTAGAKAWRPASYDLVTQPIRSPPHSVSCSYRLMASTAYAGLHIRHRLHGYRRLSDPETLAQYAMWHGALEFGWLFQNEVELAAAVHSAAIGGTAGGDTGSGDWSPELVRLAMLGRWVSRNSRCVSTRRAFERIGRAATESCLYGQRALAMPLDGLAVLTRSPSLRLQSDWSADPGALCRASGIPVLGESKGGVVIRRVHAKRLDLQRTGLAALTVESAYRELQ